MPSAQAKFARIRDKLPHFAEVAVEVELSHPPSDVTFDCQGEGWLGQGYIDDVPASGGGYYEGWKAGAREGAFFALRASEVTARVRVTRISGLLTDTNPSIVAMAAALAVWRALSLQEPPSWAVERLESVVFGSWQQGPDFVPDLSTTRQNGGPVAR
jgi:hypothetical protein